MDDDLMREERAEQLAAEAEARFELEAGPPEYEPGRAGYFEVDGWEPYDDRAELAASRAVAAMGGRGRSSRDQHFWDIDAGTAAALMVLGAVAVPVVGVAVFVARRFRVVRR